MRTVESTVDDKIVGYTIFNSVIKNQQILGSIILEPSFYKWRRVKHLSKLLPLP